MKTRDINPHAAANFPRSLELVKDDLQESISYVKDCLEQIGECEDPAQIARLLIEASNRAWNLRADINLAQSQLAEVFGTAAADCE